MKLEAAIGTHGFRRWYERQLAESFAYLTTGVLSLVMTTVALEMLEFRSTAVELIALVGVGSSGGALCVFAWRRFHELLSRAEYVAEQAVCGSCGTYGRIRMLGSHDMPDSQLGCLLDVHCRNCGNEWTIG